MKYLWPMAALLCLSLSARAQNRPDLKDTSKLFRYVDELPKFQGGQDAWSDFLMKNLNGDVVYKVMDADSSLPRKGFRERVVLEFIVCEDGGVCNVKVVNTAKVHPEIAAEAVRVMRLSPPWTPGRQGKQKVKVYFTQPITFASE